MSTDPLSDDELLYRHIADDWLDANGNAGELSCTTKQWKDGICCDRSSLRTPQDTVFGTNRTKVAVISVGDCRSLGLTVDPDPEPDPYRSGRMNKAHCTIRLPPGLSKPGIRELRTRFLQCATTITVPDPTWFPFHPGKLRSGRIAGMDKRSLIALVVLVLLAVLGAFLVMALWQRPARPALAPPEQPAEPKALLP